MRRLRLVLQGLWCVSALFVLAIVLWFFDGRPNSDVDEVLAIGMLALSFPLGVAVAAIVGAAGRLLASGYGLILSVSYVSIVVTWVVFFAVGYWQWFVGVPWILRKANAWLR